ncbi:hypothetical protein Cni_G14100 [Canna indica]|uniref:HAT C-terminal dimerisation domain-containing protein n=1 Tax=Canna indica TaxID=4628 RepID=A0AAQ3KFQ1_9LILI|nr:hypothetical protein Cni_G14100 [Canna indica]
MYYPGSHFEYGSGSGSGGTSNVGSTSAARSIDRRYYLNPAYQYKYNLGTVDIEWWLQFGIKTSSLRKIATRILSQTTSSSGCENNWSTFALIHTKPCNCLSYARLEKLVYVHYNMRLRMQALQNEDRDILHGHDLCSFGLSTSSTSKTTIHIRLSIFTIKGKEEDNTFIFKGKRQRERGPIDPLNAIAKVEEDEEDEFSVHSSSSTEDRGDDDNDGAGGEDTVVPSTPAPTDLWTNEQYFDHSTQDQDHGARTGGTTRVYEKRGRRQGGGPTSLQDYHHDMMSSLQEVSESIYYVSSTYSTDDTWTSSWTANKETLMGMWYNGDQGMMT